MLRVDKYQTIEGVTVFEDHEAFDTFYLLPEQPRFRRDDNGDPVFKFLKYRQPVTHEDGSKGGGFAIFDIEFVVPDEKVESIVETLQQQVNDEAERRDIDDPPDVKIGNINFTKGTADLNVFNENEALVESVWDAGKPSLFGRNISTWSVELTPEGATLFEEAMQGKGPVVNVVYDLWFTGKLPPMEVTASFNASAFYEFEQEIDIDWNLWGEDDYEETVREQLLESESMQIEIDPGGITDPDLVQEVRTWATKTLEDAVERKMIESIEPVSEEDRERPEGIENVTRDISNTKVSSFSLNFTEHATVDWNRVPQGSLTAITSLEDGEGNPIEWEEYATEVDLEDPFFQTLNVAAYVNADFDELPLHSVELQLTYDGRPMQPGEVRFTTPEDVGHFESFVEDDNWSYTYRYQINYEGESRAYESDSIETDEGILTIGIGDTGILDVKVRPGDLDFEQVTQALVTMHYEDSDADVGPLEQQFILVDSDDLHRFQEVIFDRVSRPYEYKVKYFMEDGKELETEWRQARTPDLYIDDAFSNTRTISLRAGGDLENEISNIFLDLTYTDEENEYVQETSVALNQDNNFFDWTIPVIKEQGGTVTYAGTIQFRDGTTETVEEAELDGNTLVIPTVEEMAEIQVRPDLLDFDEVDMCVVTLTYTDEENDVFETQDFVFSADDNTAKTWGLQLEDAEKSDYEWEAQFFLADGTSRTAGPEQTSQRTLVLQLPEE